MIEFQAGISAAILKSGEMRGLLLQSRALRSTYKVRMPPLASNSCLPADVRTPSSSTSTRLWLAGGQAHTVPTVQGRAFTHAGGMAFASPSLLSTHLSLPPHPCLFSRLLDACLTPFAPSASHSTPPFTTTHSRILLHTKACS